MQAFKSSISKQSPKCKSGGWSVLKITFQAKPFVAQKTLHRMASYPRVLQCDEVCHVTCRRPNPDSNPKLTLIQSTDPKAKAVTCNPKNNPGLESRLAIAVS